MMLFAPKEKGQALIVYVLMILVLIVVVWLVL